MTTAIKNTVMHNCNSETPRFVSLVAVTYDTNSFGKRGSGHSLQKEQTTQMSRSGLRFVTCSAATPGHAFDLSADIRVQTVHYALQRKS
jgi:hypothetical protein